MYPAKKLSKSGFLLHLFCKSKTILRVVNKDKKFEGNCIFYLLKLS